MQVQTRWNQAHAPLLVLRAFQRYQEHQSFSFNSSIQIWTKAYTHTWSEVDFWACFMSISQILIRQFNFQQFIVVLVGALKLTNWLTYLHGRTVAIFELTSIVVTWQAGISFRGL